MPTTIIAPNGSRITVPDPTPAELATSMAETCLRIVTRDIQRGNLSGAIIPDPLSKWRVEWGPLFTGCNLIEVNILCAGDPTFDERAAAILRLRELGYDPIVAIHERPEAVSFDLTIEVGN